MTDTEPPQHAVYAGVPTGQIPYGQAAYGHAAEGWAQHGAVPFPVTPKRPPLAARQKRGAAWAGIVGFNLLSFGYTMVVIPIVVGLFGAFLGFILHQMARSSSGSDPGFREFQNFFTALDLGVWLIPGIIVSVVGIIVMVVALLLSSVILKGHAVNRVWAVTWAGAGVAIVAFWFVNWFPGLLAQVAFGALGVGDFGIWARVGIAASIYALLGIIVNAVVGWLAWWWMAYAFRAKTVSAAVATATTT